MEARPCSYRYPGRPYRSAPNGTRLVVTGAALGAGAAQPHVDPGEKPRKVVGVPGLRGLGRAGSRLERGPATPHEGGDLLDQGPVGGPTGRDQLICGPGVTGIEV